MTNLDSRYIYMLIIHSWVNVYLIVMYSFDLISWNCAVTLNIFKVLLGFAVTLSSTRMVLQEGAGWSCSSCSWGQLELGETAQQ